MKRSEKQLPSKANCSILANCVNGLRVTKIVKEIKFEGVSSEQKSKNYFRDNHSQNI